MEPDLTAEVQALIAEVLQVPLANIPPSLEFGGIPEWDSMGHMSVIMALEERFGINIDADAIATLTGIPEICKTILSQSPKGAR
jgi:acyl carrier protein